MSTQPTVGDLAHKAMQLVDTLNNEVARNFIRMNNIRSMTKLETLLKPIIDGTENLDKYAVTEEQSQAAAKAATKKAVEPKKSAEKTEPKKAEKKFERKGREERATTIVEAGPRGFRFGDKWNESIHAGEGIAFRPQNINKLLKQAVEMGVGEGTMQTNDPAKIAKAISAKLNKQQAAE